MVDIYKNTATTVPGDPPQAQIDRTPLDVNDIGGRKSGLPPVDMRPTLAVTGHVPNNSSGPGEK